MTHIARVVLKLFAKCIIAGGSAVTHEYLIITHQLEKLHLTSGRIICYMVPNQINETVGAMFT
jgi:hypothetical protein